MFYLQILSLTHAAFEIQNTDFLTDKQKRYAEAQQENEKLRKQVERMKKKHTMEMATMKHYLADSRLPESAREPLFCQGSASSEEIRATFPDDDQSWRAAFGPSYQ